MLEIDVTLLISSYLNDCESIGVSLYKDPNYKIYFFRDISIKPTQIFGVGFNHFAGKQIFRP